MVKGCECWRAGGMPGAAAILSWEDICCAVRVGGAAQPRQILTDISGIAGAPAAASPAQRRAAPTNGDATNGSAAGDSELGHGGEGRADKRQGTNGLGGAAGGSICAILGPSGAGKTTLLDILAGRRHGAGDSMWSVPSLPL